MAHKKIDELTNLTSIASNDLFIAYDISEPGDEKTKKFSFDNLEKSINELYYSGNKAFSTNSNGIIVYNPSNNSDSFQIVVDNSTVYRHYHSGGGVYVQARNSSSVDKNLWTGLPDGAVDIYYAGLKKFETTTDGTQTTGNSYITGDVTIGGNLTVTGTQFIANVEEVQIEDNLMLLNKNETGAGVTAGTAGLEIERGTATNYQFLFHEATDTFRVGLVGDLQAVATRQDSPTVSGVAYWNNSQNRFDTASGFTVNDIATKTYINSVFSNKYEIIATSGTNTFTADFDMLDGAMGVYVDGVRQHASAFTFSSPRTIILSETVASGTALAVIAMEADAIVTHLHDDRYYTETELNSGQLNNLYYTESEINTISGALNAAKFDKSGGSITGATTINITDNTNPALKITQAGTADILYLEDVESDTTPLVIDASGRVIIGQPTSTTVNSVAANLQIVGSSNAYSGMLIGRYSNDATGPVIRFFKSRSTTPGTFTTTLTGDDLGALYFLGDDGYTTKLTSYIRADSYGTIASGTVPSYIRVYTTNDGATSASLKLEISETTTVPGTLAVGTLSLTAAPSVDESASGMITTLTVDANVTNIGTALCMTSSGTLLMTDADSATSMPCVALALETGTGSKKVLLQGFIRRDSWNWTPGGIMYVSTSAGGLTQTAPTGAGDQVQRVGFATHADRIFFNPDYTVIEI
jgi:hypothetical protein